MKIRWFKIKIGIDQSHELLNQLEQIILSDAKNMVDMGLIVRFEDLIKYTLKKHRHKDCIFDEIMQKLRTYEKKVSVSDIIKKVFTSLIQKGYFKEGSRVNLFNILDNEIRNCIFQFIKLNPGVIFTDFKKFNIANETIYYHLERLITFKLIRSQTVNKKKAYFHKYFPEEFDNFVFFYRKPIFHEIIQFLYNFNSRKNLSKVEIQKHVRVSRTNLYYYLKTCQKFGFFENNHGN